MDSTVETRIEFWPIEKFLPYARNPRKMTGPSIACARRFGNSASKSPCSLAATANAERDLELNPRKRLQIVVWRGGRKLDLASAKCKRELTADGFLSELVEVDGSPDQVSDEEMQEFIASFPLQRPERKRRIAADIHS